MTHFTLKPLTCRFPFRIAWPGGSGAEASFSLPHTYIMPAQHRLSAPEHLVVILPGGLFWEKVNKLSFHPD